jgi:hypothetical protein
MNIILIPLLLIIHYVVATSEHVMTHLHGYHFVPAMACFAFSAAVYGASLFEWGKAKLAITCWYLVVAYNLLSYLERMLFGTPFLLAAAGVALLLYGIIHTLYQKQSLPLPGTRLQRACLALWLLTLSGAAYSALFWLPVSLHSSLQPGIAGFLAFLLIPTLRTPRLWLAPIQMVLAAYCGACLGLPDLNNLDVFEAITALVLCVSAATVLTLGWANVYAFIQRTRERGQTDPPAAPSEESLS